MTNSEIDILVCGAGAAGLTLGIELARRGISFRLIEKRETPFDGSRGKGVQPRSQEVFEDLGILDKVMASGGLYPLQRHYRPDGTYADVSMADDAVPTPAEPYHWALMVPQFRTEAIMRERLAEQLITELALEAVGVYAQPFVQDTWAEIRGGSNTPRAGADYAATVAPMYFNYRKTSIYAGSNEIQHNIMAKMVLGL